MATNALEAESARVNLSKGAELESLLGMRWVWRRATREDNLHADQIRQCHPAPLRQLVHDAIEEAIEQGHGDDASRLIAMLDAYDGDSDLEEPGDLEPDCIGDRPTYGIDQTKPPVPPHAWARAIYGEPFIAPPCSRLARLSGKRGSARHEIHSEC